MQCLNTRMLLQYQLPALTTIVFLLCRTTQTTAAARRRSNPREHNFFYKEYKEVLKASNMTAFPDGDIRNLFIQSHEWTQNRNRKLDNVEPAVTQASDIRDPAPQTLPVPRRQRKKNGRKGRRHYKKVAKARLPTPSSFWRKQLFGMREKQEDGEPTNELDTQPGKVHSTMKNQRRASRKDRRKNRKSRQRQQQSASKPIKGQTTLSLSIARLKQRCKTKPMKQEIKVQGCMSKSIMNNFCYGQCNSFYIPEVRGKGNGPPTFTSCGFCRPRTVRPIYVTLRCTNRRGHIRWKRKKVPYVKKCRCMEQEIKLDPL